jgi:small subunit ribosomal protein S16
MASGAEQPLRLALDRVAHWTDHGAQPSPTVSRLLTQAKKATA